MATPPKEPRPKASKPRPKPAPKGKATPAKASTPAKEPRPKVIDNKGRHKADAAREKRMVFAREYLVDLNATQAAIRAGFSEKTATSAGHRLLTYADVQAEVTKLKAERAEKVAADAEWVLRRLVADVTADLADLYDDNGNMKPVKDWPVVFRTGLVAGLDTAQEKLGEDDDGRPTYGVVHKVKLADRTRLLELLGRHVDVAAFKDKLEVDVKTELADRLARARANASRRV